MKKPGKTSTTGGSAGGGFSEILGNPTNTLGQQTDEIPDPLIYGYQRGGQVANTPGNMFRRRLAIMRRVPGYQRGGRVEDDTNTGQPAWAGKPPVTGQPTGNLPPGLQGTLPPGLTTRETLPPGLSNWQNRGQIPDQSNVSAAQGNLPTGLPTLTPQAQNDWRNRFPKFAKGGVAGQGKRKK